MESMELDKKFWQGRKVLVTGHTGFKGSWLLLLLKSLEADVWGYSLPEGQGNELFRKIKKSKQLEEVISVEGDIDDTQSLGEVIRNSQPEVVIHLAAQSLVREGYKDPIGTWKTNTIGSINLLECLKELHHKCAVVMVTTDKVYENNEWVYGYRENDRLGGDDPYSASKAGAEIAIKSWRLSFCCKEKHKNIRVATARAGNVIGGGDWAKDRIIPDIVRAINNDETIKLRNPYATRPWQHVLEPLSGYLLLAQKLLVEKSDYYCEAFNFGPHIESNCSVEKIVRDINEQWGGRSEIQEDPTNPKEAQNLHLQIDKAEKILGWKPKWDYMTTIEKTTRWYKRHSNGEDATECCLQDIKEYFQKKSTNY